MAKPHPVSIWGNPTLTGPRIMIVRALNPMEQLHSDFKLARQWAQQWPDYTYHSRLWDDPVKDTAVSSDRSTLHQ